MKKIIFLLLVSTCIVNAQQNEDKIGIKGGFNFSTFTGYNDSGITDFSRRISFHAGIMLESKLSNIVSLQPEVLFSSQGSDEEFDGVDYENRLNYVNLPILFKFYVSNQFSLDVGPQLGVLISAKQSNTSTRDNDIKTYFKDTDISLATGISYKFVSGFNLSARYNFGLKDIFNTDLYQYGDKLKNGVFQLSIGYYFKNRN